MFAGTLLSSDAACHDPHRVVSEVWKGEVVSDARYM